MIRRISIFLMLSIVVQIVGAQSITEYYKSAKGKSGKELKTSMYAIIKDHTVRAYGQLWEDFEKTDSRSDGKVWDMYSNVTSYTFGGSEQGASASGEGVSYNREHSFPKSWFSGVEGMPMYSDLFHLYPVDSYINTMRSNLPFGETDKPTKMSKNGWSKYGPSSVEGYTGTVFEPNDEYKGDFARSYFYVATCYENVIAEWMTKSGDVYPMLNCTSYPAFSGWALKMLLRWAKEDPVSQKEIDRNNAVYGIQKNRNPFIDYPGLEQYIWGDKISDAFDPIDYVPGFETDTESGDKKVASPTFSVAADTVKKGTEIVISCATGGATIYFRLGEGKWQSHLAPATVVIEQTTTLSAYAQKGEVKSELVKVDYFVTESSTSGATYVKIVDENDLEIGAKYLIVCEEENVAMSNAHEGDYRNGAEVNIVSHSIVSPVGQMGYPYTLTLGGSKDRYTFYDEIDKTYLAAKTSKNKLASVAVPMEDEAYWNISIIMDHVTISSVKFPEKMINYNNNIGTLRFTTYKLSSNMLPVSLFKEANSTAIEYPLLESNGTVDVYSVSGHLLRDDVKKENAIKGLPAGVYVIGGLKVLVK